MSLATQIQTVCEALGADMRTAFGWSSGVPIYLNGTTVPPTVDTYGEIEFSLPDIGRGPAICNDECEVPFELSGRWPASAVPSGTLRGIFQIEQGAALYALLTAAPRYHGAAFPNVNGINLDDMDAEEEGGVVVTVSFSCRIMFARGEA